MDNWNVLVPYAASPYTQHKHPQLLSCQNGLNTLFSRLWTTVAHHMKYHFCLSLFWPQLLWSFTWHHDHCPVPISARPQRAAPTAEARLQNLPSGIPVWDDQVSERNLWKPLHGQVHLLIFSAFCFSVFPHPPNKPCLGGWLSLPSCVNYFHCGFWDGIGARFSIT